MSAAYPDPQAVLHRCGSHVMPLRALAIVFSTRELTGHKFKLSNIALKFRVDLTGKIGGCGLMYRGQAGSLLIWMVDFDRDLKAASTTRWHNFLSVAVASFVFLF